MLDVVMQFQDNFQDFSLIIYIWGFPASSIGNIFILPICFISQTLKNPLVANVFLIRKTFKLSILLLLHKFVLCYFIIFICCVSCYFYFRSTALVTSVI